MKPGISIIGCGRVGTALAVFLAQAGYPLAGLASKRISSARNAAALAGTGQVFAHGTDAAQQGKIIFITTHSWSDKINSIKINYHNLKKNTSQI